MMIRNDDGSYVGGPKDLILILHDTETELYHVAFYEEKPLPGSVAEEALGFTRLKIKLHHTAGKLTFEEAIEELDKLAARIKLIETNVWRKPEQVVAFEGSIPAVMFMPPEGPLALLDPKEMPQA